MWGKTEVQNENLTLTNKLNLVLKTIYKNFKITESLKFSLSSFPYDNHRTLHLNATFIEFLLTSASISLPITEKLIILGDTSKVVKCLCVGFSLPIFYLCLYPNQKVLVNFLISNAQSSQTKNHKELCSFICIRKEENKEGT